jgi:peroxiredoxin Q/BCP
VEKYHLPFTLLSDPEHKVIESFGAWGQKTFWGRKYDGIFRNTYLIDPKGVLRKIYENVKPDEHAVEILKDIASYV